MQIVWNHWRQYIMLLLALEQATGSFKQIQSERSKHFDRHWCSKPVCISAVFCNFFIPSVSKNDPLSNLLQFSFHFTAVKWYLYIVTNRMQKKHLS